MHVYCIPSTTVYATTMCISNKYMFPCLAVVIQVKLEFVCTCLCHPINAMAGGLSPEANIYICLEVILKFPATREHIRYIWFDLSFSVYASMLIELKGKIFYCIIRMQ